MRGARIVACCTLLETGLAQLSKSGNGLRRIGNLRPLANTRKQLRRLPPAAIAGVLRVMYLDAASMLLLRCPRCLEELRCRSPRERGSPQPRSETGRRAVARSVSIMNQVG
jgi:hypothetical protein